MKNVELVAKLKLKSILAPQSSMDRIKLRSSVDDSNISQHVKQIYKIDNEWVTRVYNLQDLYTVENMTDVVEALGGHSIWKKGLNSEPILCAYAGSNRPTIWNNSLKQFFMQIADVRDPENCDSTFRIILNTLRATKALIDDETLDKIDGKMYIKVRPFIRIMILMMTGVKRKVYTIESDISFGRRVRLLDISPEELLSCLTCDLASHIETFSDSSIPGSTYGSLGHYQFYQLSSNPTGSIVGTWNGQWAGVNGSTSDPTLSITLESEVGGGYVNRRPSSIDGTASPDSALNGMVGLGLQGNTNGFKVRATFTAMTSLTIDADSPLARPGYDPIGNPIYGGTGQSNCTLALGSNQVRGMICVSGKVSDGISLGGNEFIPAGKITASQSISFDKSQVYEALAGVWNNKHGYRTYNSEQVSSVDGVDYTLLLTTSDMKESVKLEIIDPNNVFGAYLYLDEGFFQHPGQIKDKDLTMEEFGRFISGERYPEVYDFSELTETGNFNIKLSDFRMNFSSSGAHLTDSVIHGLGMDSWPLFFHRENSDHSISSNTLHNSILDFTITDKGPNNNGRMLKLNINFASRTKWNVDSSFQHINFPLFCRIDSFRLRRIPAADSTVVTQIPLRHIIDDISVELYDLYDLDSVIPTIIEFPNHIIANYNNVVKLLKLDTGENMAPGELYKAQLSLTEALQHDASVLGLYISSLGTIDKCLSSGMYASTLCSQLHLKSIVESEADVLSKLGLTQEMVSALKRVLDASIDDEHTDFTLAHILNEQYLASLNDDMQAIIGEFTSVILNDIEQATSKLMINSSILGNLLNGALDGMSRGDAADSIINDVRSIIQARGYDVDISSTTNSIGLSLLRQGEQYASWVRRGLVGFFDDNRDSFKSSAAVEALFDLDSASKRGDVTVDSLTYTGTNPWFNNLSRLGEAILDGTNFVIDEGKKLSRLMISVLSKVVVKAVKFSQQVLDYSLDTLLGADGQSFALSMDGEMPVLGIPISTGELPLESSNIGLWKYQRGCLLFRQILLPLTKSSRIIFDIHPEGYKIHYSLYIGPDSDKELSHDKDFIEALLRSYNNALSALDKLSSALGYTFLFYNDSHLVRNKLSNFINRIEDGLSTSWQALTRYVGAGAAVGGTLGASIGSVTGSTGVGTSIGSILGAAGGVLAGLIDKNIDDDTQMRYYNDSISNADIVSMLADMEGCFEGDKLQVILATIINSGILSDLAILNINPEAHKIQTSATSGFFSSMYYVVSDQEVAAMHAKRVLLCVATVGAVLIGPKIIQSSASLLYNKGLPFIGKKLDRYLTARKVSGLLENPDNTGLENTTQDNNALLNKILTVLNNLDLSDNSYPDV